MNETKNKKKQKLIEVVRSFSRKKNLGNYETADFFCSQKSECYEDEAEETSKKAYEFCKKEVLQDYNNYGKIDWSNAPKNKPEGYFRSKELTDEQKADKAEADMQRAIDDKQEAKYEFSGKDDNGNNKFNRID